MRSTLLLPLAGLILTLPCMGDLTLRQRDVPAVVALDIRRKDIPNPVARDRLRRKRNKTVYQGLKNEETLYLSDITLGTPKQNLHVIIDTGSSDLWCNAMNSTACMSRSEPCSATGTYDASSSSTYGYVSSDFNITYADGTGAAGDYVTDTIRIGGARVEDFQFGVGYSSSSAQGVLGIGYPSNEVQVGRNSKKAYLNLPQAMVKEGLINSNAYSLWLNDLEANTGLVLFGGVNTEKYHGKLETLPIQRVNGAYSQFIIALTGVGLHSKSAHHSYSSSSLPAAVLLDSGSTLTYLPDSIVHNIYSDLHVTYDSSSGVGYVPCNFTSEDVNITYSFSSPTISVGANELVLSAGDLHFPDGTRACVFGIAPAGDSTAVLGDTFLRSAYVVYDLTNNEISLANTNFNSTKDNILEIAAGHGSVPGATPVSNPVTTVAVDGPGARIGGPSGTGTVFTKTLSTTTSEGAAAMHTSIPKHLAFGFAGAGYLLAL